MDENKMGWREYARYAEMSAEEFREVVDIDLTAPFIVSKAVIPAMIANGGGKDDAASDDPM